jgi:uncharacterized protein involved in response to NO
LAATALARRFDLAALAVVAAAMLAWTALPNAAGAGTLLVAASVLNAVRLARWRGWAAISEPLVWVLHLGYAWFCVGLLLLGLSILAPTRVPLSAALHALAAGAFGVMTLGVMTRASLGHTGRARNADAATTLIYLAANAAALLRVAAAFAPAGQNLLLSAAGGLWAVAFLGFAIAYAPRLAAARSVEPQGQRAP